MQDEQRRAREDSRIAVIGAGFSGVMTAIHLLWRARPGERVYLVERRGALGRGVAYGTRHPRHLVNVRAENMSAFADEPDHFTRWLERLPAERQAAVGARTPSGLFVRRELYGAYVQDLLQDAVVRQGGAQNLFIVTDEATALRPQGQGLVLETAGGRTYELDAAVLAVGSAPSAAPGVPGWFADPWDPAATRDLDPSLPVLVLGTGLSMVDVTLMLLDEGFQGPILALSRRGLLPLPHAPAPAWDGLALTPEERRSLLGLVRAVRRTVRAVQPQGVGWRSVIDALRPQLSQLWQELPPADRHRFLRHLRPWWDIHRHRMAPTVMTELSAARATGQLELLAGRLLGVRQGIGTLRASLRRRGRAEVEERQVQRVIDCRGLGGDVAQMPDALLRQLLGDGLARPDPYGLGLDTTLQGGLIDRDGNPVPGLFAVGALTRAAGWEIASVPDIRTRAEVTAVKALTAARRSARLALADG